MSLYPHSFTAPIEVFGVGRDRKYWYRVVFLPPELKTELPFDAFPRLRVEGEIAEVPVACAFIPTGDGRHYAIVSPKVLKESKSQPGDEVEMRFRVADQDHVEIDDALRSAIEAKPSAASAWDTTTPGKKRALGHYVATAKTVKTRSKRIHEALEVLVKFDGNFRAWRDSKKTR